MCCKGAILRWYETLCCPKSVWMSEWTSQEDLTLSRLHSRWRLIVHLWAIWKPPLLVASGGRRNDIVSVAASRSPLYWLAFVIRPVIRHVRSGLRCCGLLAVKKKRCLGIFVIDKGDWMMMRREPANERKHRAVKRGRRSCRCQKELRVAVTHSGGWQNAQYLDRHRTNRRGDRCARSVRCDHWQSNRNGIVVPSIRNAESTSSTCRKPVRSIPIGGWELRQGEQCSFAGTDTTDFALENIGARIAYLDPIRTAVNYASNEWR